MTQPPFSGNDFFDQIDSVARNLTGNAFRLKKNDPTAPQKFTEFVAQSEQEFGQQPQQQAQPQSFTDFEQGGFQVNPAGDRRAAILAQQPSSGESAFDQSIGRGIGALGRGALGLGRTHLEALEEISPAFDLGGALFAKARPYIPGVQETEFDRQFAEASARESVEGTNPFARTFNARAFREALPSASDIPIINDPRGASNPVLGLGRALSPSLGSTMPGVNDPLWELNLAELGAMVTDPLNLVPGLGTPSLVTKPLGAGRRVVTGAGKKALSAGGDYAAAVGRTGVPNVLDTVPPQTVAGRAAGGGAGDAISSGRLFQSGHGATYLDDFEKGIRTVPLPQGVSESDRLTGQQFVAAMQKTPRELSDLELVSVYEEASMKANDPMQGAIGEQVLSRLNPVISERVASGNLARAEGTSILRGYRLTEKSTKTVGATRQADAAARGVGGRVSVGSSKRAGKLLDEAGNELGDDDVITVYHSTNKETADRFVQEGVIAGRKATDRSVTVVESEAVGKMLGKNIGDPLDYEPGRGLGDGFYVGADPDRLEVFGDTVVGVRVRVGDLAVPPERSTAFKGRTDRGAQSLLVDDGYITRDIAPGDVFIERQPPTTPATGTTAARGAGDVQGIPESPTVNFANPEQVSPSPGARGIVGEKGVENKIYHGTVFDYDPADIAIQTEGSYGGIWMSNSLKVADKAGGIGAGTSVTKALGARGVKAGKKRVLEYGLKDGTKVHIESYWSGSGLDDMLARAGDADVIAIRRVEDTLARGEDAVYYYVRNPDVLIAASPRALTQPPTTPATGTTAAARGAGDVPLRPEGQFNLPPAVPRDFIDQEFRGTGGTAGRLPTDDEFIRMRDTVPEILAKPLGTLSEEDIARLGQVSANNRTPATVQNALGIRVWQETAFKKGKPLTVEQMTNAYPPEQRLIGGYSIEELGIESGAFVRQADATVVPPTTPATGTTAARGALPTHADVLDSFSDPSEFKEFVIRGKTTKPGLYEAGGTVYRLTENGDVTRLQDVVSSYSSRTKKFSFERINQEPVPSEIAPLLEGTKVVDSTGKPLRVFHGTTSDFDEFIPSKPKDVGGQTEGVYFEPTKKDAELWTRQGGVGRSRTGEPRIIEAYVNLKNPIEARLSRLTNREELIEQGYDGKISRDSDGQITEVVAFDNSQIHQVSTPATGTAVARQVTPQQQAIIDDVGTGALPADDVAVDALDVAPIARAADDASLRAIEDATPLGESARDARAAETTYTPESMTVGDDARRVFGADQTIDFKLTTKERATNRLREVLPPDSSKPGSTLGPDADPIVDRLWEEHTKINQRAINLGRTISARVTPRIKKVFKLDDNDRIPSLAGIDSEIPNAPTIQDVAARLPKYFDSMTPEQQQLIRELEVQFKPFGDALRASGDEFGTRLDIIEGGFYIPRGGAENGDQAIRLRGRGGRGTKPSSERTAKFPSMAKALDDGWEYDRLGDAINGYVASAGRRVADNFFTDAMKGVRNEAGERLGLTAKEVLVRDNPTVAARFAALTKASTKLKNLLKSKDSQLFKNLERLLADPEFDDIEAVRKAFSNSRTVLRGELKGKNIAEVRKALTDLQKELRTFKPEYEAAKKRILAGRAGGDEKRIGLSLFPQLDGITFPERMAARAEELINSTDLRAFADKKLRYADDINRVYKSVNATADNSAIGIQMLPAIYDNPWRQRRSVIASLMAWAHPDTYSDAVTQFNKRATNSGRVTSDDWAGKYGLAQVSGDANAQDVTSGLLEKGLGIPVVKKPLGSFFKRADAAFNTGGDMARLEMADDMLSEELARGRTLKELHSSGDMRRIANEASAATGYVEGKFAVENLIMFSARFFQARLLTLLRAARGLDIDAPLDLLPVVGNKLRQTGKVPTINRYSRIQDRYARRMILRTLGWGTMLTVLLNEIQGQSTDFNLMKDGKYNSNFIRFRAFGKDRSMFGPLDTMLRIFVNLSTGQAKQTAETFAQSPLASSFLDLFENKDFTGAPIFDPKGTKLEQALQILEYQATQTVPFALGEAADSIGRIIEGAKNSNPIKVGIGTLDFLSDHIGLKSSPLSSAELRELLTITSDPAIRADIQRELDERKARFRRFDKPNSGIGGAVPFK